MIHFHRTDSGTLPKCNFSQSFLKYLSKHLRCLRQVLTAPSLNSAPEASSATKNLPGVLYTALTPPRRPHRRPSTADPSGTLCAMQLTAHCWPPGLRRALVVAAAAPSQNYCRRFDPAPRRSWLHDGTPRRERQTKLPHSVCECEVFCSDNETVNWVQLYFLCYATS